MSRTQRLHMQKPQLLQGLVIKHNMGESSSVYKEIQQKHLLLQWIRKYVAWFQRSCSWYEICPIRNGDPQLYLQLYTISYPQYREDLPTSNCPRLTNHCIFPSLLCNLYLMRMSHTQRLVPYATGNLGRYKLGL